MKTMRDVAERANVSATTVSLVLGGRQPANGGISEETRRRVHEAARELGYRKNALVQAVVSGHNAIIGFVAKEPQYEFMARVLCGVLDETEAAGYAVQILRLKDNGLDHEVIERCLEMRLAGIVTVDINQNALEYLVAEMKPQHVPVAFLDTSYTSNWGIHVATDDVVGCELAIGHLLELGHTRIGYIGGRPGRGMAEARENAYRAAMERHGLEVRDQWVIDGYWAGQTAEIAAGTILREMPRPTALFCASDGMALGAQRAGRSLGLVMPRELSIMGFGNTAEACCGDPRLTTVAQPVEDLGRTATRLILARIQDSMSAGKDCNMPMEQLIPTSLVLRESTTSPP